MEHQRPDFGVLRGRDSLELGAGFSTGAELNWQVPLPNLQP